MKPRMNKLKTRTLLFNICSENYFSFQKENKNKARSWSRHRWRSRLAPLRVQSPKAQPSSVGQPRHLEAGAAPHSPQASGLGWDERKPFSHSAPDPWETKRSPLGGPHCSLGSSPRWPGCQGQSCPHPNITSPATGLCFCPATTEKPLLSKKRRVQAGKKK